MLKLKNYDELEKGIKYLFEISRQNIESATPYGKSSLHEDEESVNVGRLKCNDEIFEILKKLIYQSIYTDEDYVMSAPISNHEFNLSINTLAKKYDEMIFAKKIAHQKSKSKNKDEKLTQYIKDIKTEFNDELYDKIDENILKPLKNHCFNNELFGREI